MWQRLNSFALLLNNYWKHYLFLWNQLFNPLYISVNKKVMLNKKHNLNRPGFGNKCPLFYQPCFCSNSTYGIVTSTICRIKLCEFILSKINQTLLFYIHLQFVYVYCAHTGLKNVGKHLERYKTFIKSGPNSNIS